MMKFADDQNGIDLPFPLNFSLDFTGGKEAYIRVCHNFGTVAYILHRSPKLSRPLLRTVALSEKTPMLMGPVCYRLYS